jgi:mannose-6-phosphate isomerase
MFRRVIGAPQHYDWGDPTFIPDLFQLPRNSQPWAEMWFGTHPAAPSKLDSPEGPLLSDDIGEMTMLVKVLACTSPLSLQTHPTRQQAERGFARENATGIPLTDSKRVYKDPSDKPEILIALTEFEVLCGFDSIEASIDRLQLFGWHEEADVLDQNGIDGYLLWAFDQRTAPSMNAVPDWMSRLSDAYPADRALRVAPLLHHIVLQPGQAISLPAGNLHAYLHGAGIEVMASSDNVVRAGFTSKHVDVAELLRIVDTSALEHPISVTTVNDNWVEYSSPSSAFSVASTLWENLHTVEACNTHRFFLGPLGDDARPDMTWLPAGESHNFTTVPGTHNVAWIFTQN